MNKRQAKKKYKAIYEKRLNERVVFLNLDAINPNDKTVKFFIRSMERNFELDVKVNVVNIETSANPYPPISIIGELVGHGRLYHIARKQKQR